MFNGAAALFFDRHQSEPRCSGACRHAPHSLHFFADRFFSQREVRIVDSSRSQFLRVYRLNCKYRSLDQCRGRLNRRCVTSIARSAVTGGLYVRLKKVPRRSPLYRSVGRPIAVRSTGEGRSIPETCDVISFVDTR